MDETRLIAALRTLDRGPVTPPAGYAEGLYQRLLDERPAAGAVSVLDPESGLSVAGGPAPVTLRRETRPVISMRVAVAAFTVVILLGVATWMIWPAGHDEGAPAAPTPTAQPGTTTGDAGAAETDVAAAAVAAANDRDDEALRALFTSDGTLSPTREASPQPIAEGVTASWIDDLAAWGFEGDLRSCRSTAQGIACEVRARWLSLSMEAVEQWSFRLDGDSVRTLTIVQLDLNPEERSLPLGLQDLNAWEDWLWRSDPATAAGLAPAPPTLPVDEFSRATAPFPRYDVSVLEEIESSIGDFLTENPPRADFVYTGELEPGEYYTVVDGSGDPPIIVEYRVDAEGWQSQWTLKQDVFDENIYVGAVFVSPSDVVTDPCNDHTFVDPGATVEDLADALAALPGFVLVAAPTDVTAFGFAGKHLALEVPTIDHSPEDGFADCLQGTFLSWRVGPTGVRGYQGPRQALEFWVLDVGGRRLLIETTRFPDSMASDVAELDQIVDSIRIEP